MEITELINHPERMNRDTLYELRSLLALYPYFQTARLLMLQNLYLLHDSEFDEELRRAAIYTTDRKIIFRMIEAAHYQLRHPNSLNIAQSSGISQTTIGQDLPRQASRTVELIDTFLDSIPPDDEADNGKKRRPTPTDAAIDYVAYLLESEAFAKDEEDTPQLKGQNLIDTFLEQEHGRITLSNNFSDSLDSEEGEDTEEDTDATGKDNGRNTSGEEEEYFTETLARIYIKQGRYQKALDITKRLRQKYPQKNAYFADQIRFLEKLIINSNNINKK